MRSTNRALRRLDMQVNELRHAIDKVEVAFSVREPEGNLARDAYDGLENGHIEGAASDIDDTYGLIKLRVDSKRHCGRRWFVDQGQWLNPCHARADLRPVPGQSA